ncbi:hypothetical protein IVA79_19290 [Bradyrhizobium sp. 138]|uniref:hypothetical protein n=1 Tax=Bradyrhizobium sp. 138 TaxID=2782615 RepID=UPI001FF91064|nr:hypothetical protein [Bradyrhizobium sp. 138]MCK1736026.1 hypothetical protein [Bradyrhizobium sp. 138]
MPVLTHRLEPPLYQIERQPRLPKVHRAQLTRLALQVLTVFSMGSVLTALIALRTAIHVWHLPA